MDLLCPPAAGGGSRREWLAPIRFPDGARARMLPGMDLLLHFRTFVRVAELGGFSAAARALGSSQPAVSRQVADLEARLGARLFHRSAAGVALTEDGALFLAEARAALGAAEAAMGAVGARLGEVSGRVRLGCGVAFGRLMVVPRLAPLLARHPGLSVELVMSDAAADLVQEGLDATFRIGQLIDPAVVARRVGVTRRAVVAAPDHLARHGEPAHPRDLAARDCVIFTGLATGEAWPFEGPEGPFQVRVAGRFRANSSEAVREAVLAGIGPALVPLWLFGPELAAGRVRALLPAFTPAPLPIHLVLPTRRQVPARVRALVEHLAAAFQGDPLLAETAPAPRR